MPDAIEAAARWEWMCGILAGEGCSDFAESFPEIRQLSDLMHEVERLRAMVELDCRVAGVCPDVPVWIPVADRMPEPGRMVLAFYKTVFGMDRRIRAMYAAPKTLELSLDAEGGEYDEETDTYWCDPGWYEANEHEECHWRVDEEITHWMPLPAPPSAESV
jgi:hypothetical protein